MCARTMALAITVFVSAGLASDGITVTTVHRPGDPMPGMPGFSYGGASGGSLNDAGDMIVSASISGPDVTLSNDNVLLAGHRSDLRLIARERDAIPSLPGFIWLPGSINLTGFDNLVVTPTGEIGFDPSIWEVGVSTVVLGSVFAGAVPTPSALLWVNADPPGFDPSYNTIALNRGVFASGARAALSGRINGPSVERVVWFGNPGEGLVAALQTHLPAPGFLPTVTIGNIDDGSLRMNDQGRIAFQATLAGTGITAANATVIYEGLPDNLGVLAHAGDPLPGVPGAVYGLLDPDSIRMNAAGAVCFKAAAVGGGTDNAIVSSGSGQVFTLVKDGDPVPGVAGATINNLNRVIDMNGNGRVIFTASLTGQAAGADTACFIGDPNGIEMVLREGDPLPGGYTAPDLLGLKFFFNDRDQVVFVATVGGSPTLFATRPNGGLVKLARAAEVFATDDGFVGVPGALVPWRFDSGALCAGNGGPSVFNNTGEFMLAMYFSGSTGSALVLFDIDDPCPADFAAPEGELNFFDISAFIAAYNASDPSADLAEPIGVFNFFDISGFVAMFNAGCPD